MDNDQNYFDNIVIGSSPLMLLVAINIIIKGSNVLLIEKNKNMGGCWQFHKNGNLTFESASHLIEKYPGVYQILEKYSSEKFKPLKEQPIRVFKNGFIVPYENKIILIITFCKLLFGYFYSEFSYKFFKKNLENKINYQHKLNDFLKYIFKNIFDNSVLYGPINGYAALVKGLIKKCLKRSFIL